MHPGPFRYASARIATRIGKRIRSMPLLFEQSAPRIHPNDDILGAVLLCLLLGPERRQDLGMRKIEDPIAKPELLTKAQMLLTAFVLNLKQLPEKQASPATLRAGLDQMVRLAA
jgi:hypothetical protein